MAVKDPVLQYQREIAQQQKAQLSPEQIVKQHIVANIGKPLEESVVFELLPGLYLTDDMTWEERLEISDMAESYFPPDVPNYEDLGWPSEVTLEVIGVVYKPLDPAIDKKTGDMRRHNILTVVKYRKDGKEGVIGFVSAKVTEWAKKMIAVSGRAGDFPTPVTYQIRQIVGPAGEDWFTYVFTHVKK